MIAMAQVNNASQPTDWQAGFLCLLPRIERTARSAFRRLRDDAREDAVCEVIANCFRAYHRLHERRLLHRAFASPLVRFAVAQYYAGRRVGSSQCGHDCYGQQVRNEEQVQFRSIGTPREQRQEWLECLTENYRTPVPDQVHYRVEFPRWFRGQSRRNRQIAERLALGYTTAEVARQFRLSPGRISQLRRELHDSWQEFTADRQTVARSIRPIFSAD